MKNEAELLKEIEKCEKEILFTNTKMNIREKLVTRVDTLRWVLEDNKPVMRKRLQDAGIISPDEETVEDE